MIKVALDVLRPGQWTLGLIQYRYNYRQSDADSYNAR